jgi:hypothetical protein
VAWLVEAADWEGKLQQRLGVVRTVKAALRDGNVTDATLASALDALAGGGGGAGGGGDGGAGWLLEAPGWKAQLDRRHQVTSLVLDEALADSNVAVATIEAAVAVLKGSGGSGGGGGGGASGGDAGCTGEAWLTIETSKREILVP